MCYLLMQVAVLNPPPPPRERSRPPDSIGNTRYRFVVQSPPPRNRHIMTIPPPLGGNQLDERGLGGEPA